jgi:hypothetical protein
MQRRVVRCDLTDYSQEHIASIFTFETAFCYWLLHADSLLGLFLNPEDGGYLFLRNVG